MKFPKHIILDTIKSNNTLLKIYWKNVFFKIILKKKYYFNTLNCFKFFKLQKKFLSNALFFNKTKFTFKHVFTNKVPKENYLSYWVKKNKIRMAEFRLKKNMKAKIKNRFENTVNYLFYKKFYQNKKFFSNVYNFINFTFNINFIKKEKIYTKLKYSRVPQYDIVSGASAALFAGFLGFLAAEKFGFELVDSGDFYYLFMYLVFLFFILRLFLKLLSDKNYSWNVFSLKFFFFYIFTIFKLILKKFNYFFNYFFN